MLGIFTDESDIDIIRQQFWFLCGISLFVFIGGFRVFDFLINIIVLLKFSIEIEMFNLLSF